MTCLTINHICCLTKFYRLRTFDGGYVFLDWHDYLGPDFYRDRKANRPIRDWWKDDGILRALEWFLWRDHTA
jgi:hypothetical protein